MVAGAWQGTHDIRKGAACALFLTYQESRKFTITVKSEATVDAQCGICICHRRVNGDVLKHISAWASALLVQL